MSVFLPLLDNWQIFDEQSVKLDSRQGKERIGNSYISVACLFLSPEGKDSHGSNPYRTFLLFFSSAKLDFISCRWVLLVIHFSFFSIWIKFSIKPFTFWLVDRICFFGLPIPYFLKVHIFWESQKICEMLPYFCPM